VRRTLSLVFGLSALVLLNVSPAFAAVSVPEPATATVLGMALGAWGIRAYRKRAQ
jgi:hypothetical protein